MIGTPLTVSSTSNFLTFLQFLTVWVHIVWNWSSNLFSWCMENLLQLNVSKSKELALDLRLSPSQLQSLTLNGQTVERTDVKYMGAITESSLCFSAIVNLVYYARNPTCFTNLVYCARNPTCFINCSFGVKMQTLKLFSKPFEFRQTEECHPSVRRFIVMQLHSLDTIFSTSSFSCCRKILLDHSHILSQYIRQMPSERRFSVWWQICLC